MLAELICASAFAIELTRAMSGNTLSWAYVFEWPFLGAYAIYMWHKLLRDDDAPREVPTTNSPHEAQRLRDYNDYLSRVHGAVAPPSNPHTDESVDP